MQSYKIQDFCLGHLKLTYVNLPITYQLNLDLNLIRLILNELICQPILLTNLTYVNLGIHRLKND